jgi:glycosyltransferase involved in cell wall biosynthesis
MQVNTNRNKRPGSVQRFEFMNGNIDLSWDSQPIPPPASPHEAKPKFLAICNIDGMAWAILRTWLVGLRDKGYEVHLACAPGAFSERLVALGLVMHPVSIRRSFQPLGHILPVFQLWKLLRRGDFAVINVHSAVGAALGRIAATLAGSKPVVYTVHGFYFHEEMAAIPKALMMGFEWLLGLNTQGFMFVSEEDHRTAVQTGIARSSARCVTIFNGVDLTAFAPKESFWNATQELKLDLGIDDSTPVVGIVGRIVREKGFREFLEMACAITTKRKVAFIVVGDTLPSDRDNFGPTFRQMVARAGLASHFVFTGLTDRVPDYLRIMDIFVLPSYREGFPRSVIEAMSAGVPVVATDIRGCREAVLPGKTGLIVPPKEGRALSNAVEYLLENPGVARAMGHAGRARATLLYDEVTVQQNFVRFIDDLVFDTVNVGPAARSAEGQDTAC